MESVLVCFYSKNHDKFLMVLERNIKRPWKRSFMAFGFEERDKAGQNLEEN